MIKSPSAATLLENSVSFFSNKTDADAKLKLEQTKLLCKQFEAMKKCDLLTPVGPEGMFRYNSFVDKSGTKFVDTTWNTQVTTKEYTSTAYLKKYRKAIQNLEKVDAEVAKFQAQ